ncbi:MAG TPA: hypothetical protein VK589_00310 [Chryseolinea sp.]|nr:hypothetical protein [Chryseolinea sp.]
MRNGSSFWKGAVIFVLAISAHGLLAQVENDKKVKGNDIEVTHTPFERYWTKPRIVPKVGVGTMDRAFVELGVQWHDIYKAPLTLVSKGPYCTVDIFIDHSNILLGPKLGYEFTAGLFGAAVDMTYFIDHNYDHEGGNRSGVQLTPKAGISILGFADLFYGYAIPLTEERISTITRNRFSLVFNLNKDYFDLKEARRKTPRNHF